MTPEILAALIAFAFVSSITPGPNNLMLMASGANFGVRRTIPHALGVGIGFTVMTMMVGLGLAQVFDAVPASYIVLKIASVVYLLYLAWKIATAAPLTADDGASTERAPSGGKPLTFLQAAAFQWVNPKAWAMALTAVSAYAAAGDLVISVLIVALVFGAVNIPSVSMWVVMGVQLRRLLSDVKRLRIFNIVMGLALVATIIPILTQMPS